MKKPKKTRRDPDAAMHNQTRTIDALAGYELYAANILPAIRKDLEAGLSAIDILKKYSPLAAARAVTVALMEEDGSKALAASKQVIEHTVGKPTEKKEIKHQFEELKDEELDALLNSELKKLKVVSED